MMHSVEKVFPEIKHPAYLTRREACWEMALSEGGLKADYRKKQLQLMKSYFFTGAYTEEMEIAKYRGTLLKMFPVQTAKGYDYFYSQYEFDKKVLQRMTSSALVEATRCGMDEEAQLAYWDYHLGDKFTETVTRQCKNGSFEVSMNSINIAKSIGSRLRSYVDDPEDYLSFYSKRLPYYFSVLKHVTTQLKHVKSQEFFNPKELKAYYLEFFVKIQTKNFENCVENDDRFRIADEFARLMETTDGLPLAHLDLWERAKKTCR